MSSNIAIVCAVVALLAVSCSAYQNILVQSFNTSNMCVGPSNSMKFPLNQCLYGSTYSCKASLDQCLDMMFYSGKPCDAKTLGGPNTMVCGTCYPITNGNNTLYGKFKNCRSEATRAFDYDCDISCNNCKSSVLVPMNQCLVNPITNVQTVVLKKVRPCGVLITSYAYNVVNCTGPAQMFKIPSGVCDFGSVSNSQMMTCQ